VFVIAGFANSESSFAESNGSFWNEFSLFNRVENSPATRTFAHRDLKRDQTNLSGRDQALRNAEYPNSIWNDLFGAGLLNLSPLRSSSGSELPMLRKSIVSDLKPVISRYQKIVSTGGWPQIPKGKILRTNAVGPRVKLLRRRLLISGDMGRLRGFNDVFDSYVTEAVRRFQRRHGLRVTGVVNRRTLHALNVKAKVRLKQLQLNLSRFVRSLEKGRPDRFVFVNIPSSELEAVEGNNVQQRHRVVVGKPQFPTPQLRTRIVELNFYPYWHVPDSIARRDILPKLLKNTGYLKKTNTRVFQTWGGKELDPRHINWQSANSRSFKFRQDPGRRNALGVLRLNMPNKHAVYLHDTPLKNLFGRSVRAYSAGCVRVQNIPDLAQWLLKPNNDWTRGKIDKVVNDGASRNAPLKAPVPVYFEYFTAWTDGEGNAHFRPDIYEKDSAKLVASAGPNTLQE